MELVIDEREMQARGIIVQSIEVTGKKSCKIQMHLDLHSHGTPCLWMAEDAQKQWGFNEIEVEQIIDKIWQDFESEVVTRLFMRQTKEV